MNKQLICVYCHSRTSFSVLFNAEIFLLGQSGVRYLVQQSGSDEVFGCVVSFSKWELNCLYS